MSTTEILSIIQIVGIATILPIALGLLIDKKKKKFESRQQLDTV